MKTQVIASGLALTPELRELAERHLAYSLSRFSTDLEEVWLFLRRENDARRGTTYRCRIVTTVKGSTEVSVERLGSTPESAIKRSCRGGERSIALATSRSKTWRGSTRHAL